MIDNYKKEKKVILYSNFSSHNNGKVKMKI
jgi:hypothetical protein